VIVGESETMRVGCLLIVTGPSTVWIVIGNAARVREPAVATSARAAETTARTMRERRSNESSFREGFEVGGDRQVF
jgi:hypothetical protein